jgi:hypothetical protein
MDLDQHAHPRSLVKIHVVRLQVEILIANSMVPDQTARMRRCWSQTHYAGFVMARLIFY